MANDLIMNNGKMLITENGGIAYKFINKTGAASVRGEYVVPSAAVDNAVVLGTDAYDFIGVIHQAGVPDGSEMWVITEGVGHFLLEAGSAATRSYIIFPHSTTPGRVVTTVIPVPPNDDQHFRECGHCIQTAIAGQLFLGILHKN